MGTGAVSSPPEETPWTHHEASVGGVYLHYVEAGRGPPVILLHGFPEFWYSWRHQISALAAAGFRVIAPDMRGYNQSEKPPGVDNYRIKLLAEDVTGLIRHAGSERAVIAGHDWGGAVAWYLAMVRPETVERLIVLNSPHPAAFFRELWTPVQLYRSWYMFFFQLPWLPEMIFRAGGFAGLRSALRKDPARPDAFSEEDIRRYVDAIAQPGALTAAINYYRASFRRTALGAGRRPRRIDAPTLLIWGEQDRYLGIQLTEGLSRWVPNLRIERLPHASHWVQCDAPDIVNRLMVDFIRES